TTNDKDVVKVLQDVVNHSSIDLGDGNNVLNIGGTLESQGGQYGTVDNSTITAGADNDTVYINRQVTNGSTINLGDGDNDLTVNAAVTKSTITTGDGKDLLWLVGVSDGTKVSTGAGDDIIHLGKRDADAPTDFAASVNVGSKGSVIDGGDGLDILYYHGAQLHDGASVNNLTTANIELIQIDGTQGGVNAGQRNQFNLTLSDLTQSGDTLDTVFINSNVADLNGYKLNTIDLGGNNKVYNYNGMNNVKPNLGEFSLAEQNVQAKDPTGETHTYNVYKATAADGHIETVYIQDTFFVI
ncbi:hypothetical protein, partial [Otariodibacter sp.]|uniref:hypothetical protein n=1 Tax=Otariodibacter sp. TaxID=3030919 RepID=UPI002603104E